MKWTMSLRIRAINMRISCVNNIRCYGLRYFSSPKHSQEISTDLMPSDRSITPKSKEFYAHMGAERKYYYVFNTRGQVFLEDTIPRNIATSLKDPKFVNFMHSNLKPNDTTMECTTTYPLVVYCGKETNFVSPQDTLSAFVFRDLVRGKDRSPITDIAEVFDQQFSNYSNYTNTSSSSSSSSSSSNKTDIQLCYGHDILHSFDPTKLIYMPDTGRLYHKVLSHKYLCGHLGLLHPFLCQQISQYISYSSSDESSNNSTSASDKYVLEWGAGNKFELPTMI